MESKQPSPKNPPPRKNPNHNLLQYLGLGIGLALVRSLVDSHRGTVEARSTIGQSSEFIVKLPFA
jgi:signal transduction histidine kinase